MSADLTGTDFSISSYIDNKLKSQIQVPHENRDSVKDAIQWQGDSNIIIISTANNLNELEELWIAFNQMPIRLRRESDWKSLELFGVTNKDHYDHLKEKILARDIP